MQVICNLNVPLQNICKWYNLYYRFVYIICFSFYVQSLFIIKHSPVQNIVLDVFRGWLTKVLTWFLYNTNTKITHFKHQSMAGFSQYSKGIYSSKWTAEGDIGLKKKIHFYHVTLILNQWYQYSSFFWLSCKLWLELSQFNRGTLRDILRNCMQTLV